MHHDTAIQPDSGDAQFLLLLQQFAQKKPFLSTPRSAMISIMIATAVAATAKPRATRIQSPLLSWQGPYWEEKTSILQC
jgi:hypothetical protein